MATRELLFIQQGTKFSKNQISRRRLVLETLRLQPIVAGFTELGQNDDWQTAKTAVKEAGYRWVGNKGWEPAIAVHPSVVITGKGAKFVHGGHPNPGGFQPRHAVWFTGMVDGDPNLEISYVEFHSVTLARRPAQRNPMRMLMTQTVGGLIRENGLGHRLGFGGGDLNEADRPGDQSGQHGILAEQGIITCWDEKNYYPDTHGGNPRPKRPSAIDAIMRLKNDQRVALVDADSELIPWSDHWRVWAKYAVTVPDEPPVEPPAPVIHECADPACADVHEVVPV
jgi:hypothetical protein